MKLLYILCSILLSSCVFAQEFIINQDFTKEKINFNIPFNPDWNRDFFVEFEVRIANSTDPGIENAGLIFAFDKEIDSFYAMYISYGANVKSKYNDYFKFRTKNVTVADNDDVWQNTSLINHEGFNRLQVYKIDNQLFFAINDQVISYVSKIESKGNELQLASGKKGIYANYLQAYYLDSVKKNELKETLISNLATFKATGIHHKIADNYQKVLNLKQPSRISNLSTSVSTYIPEIDVISIGNYEISFKDYIINHDSKTGNVISNNEFKERTKNLKIYTEDIGKVHINQSDIIEGKVFIGKLQGSLILLKDLDYGFYTYDIQTKKLNKLIKISAANRDIIISDNYQYLCVYDKVFSLATGKKIEYKFTGGMPSASPIIVACYQDNIIVDKGGQLKTINLLTKEEKDFKEQGYFQDHYLMQVNGRELSIKDLSAGKYIAKNLQILAFDRNSYINPKYKYFPGFNKIYVSQDFNLTPVFYFSLNDKVVNTSSYIIDVATNEITPFLLYKSAAELQQNEENYQAVLAQSKAEVNSFLSQFKTFGSYYELNYNNFEYVNVSGNALLNKNGIRGTTYVIGKFCTYDGANLLAVGVTKDQYQIELIKVAYDGKGTFINKKTLGVTQNVNGYATQIADVKIYQNSLDKTKYTLVINDGKETKLQLTSNCK